MGNFQIDNDAWEHGIPMTEENMARFGWAKVVRCCDCRHIYPTWTGWECQRWSGEYHRASPDGFCAWGERDAE